MKRKLQSGDTLWDISQELGVSVRELLKLNPQIKDPDVIKAGQVITVPDAPSAGVQADASTTAQPQSHLGQQVRAAANAPMPSAQQAVAGINFDNPYNQHLRDAGNAASQYAQAVGSGAFSAALPAGLGWAAQQFPQQRAIGAIAPQVRGAVVHAGAKPTMTNVRPYGGNLGTAQATAANILANQPRQLSLAEMLGMLQGI